MPEAEKLSQEQERWLVSPAQLTAMKHLNLRERAQLPRLKYKIDVSASTVRMYYRRNNVRCIKVDLSSTAKLGKQNQIQAQQQRFVQELQELRPHTYVVWLDETSVNCWANLRRRVWTDGASVTIPLQAKRGANRTVFGAVGAYFVEDDAQKQFRFFFRVAMRTCAADARDFLQQIVEEAPVDPGQIIICTDNHSAHHSKITTQFAESVGLRLKFLPAYSSTLNPGKCS